MTVLLAIAAMVAPAPPPPVIDGGHKRLVVVVDRRKRAVRPYRAKLTRMAWCESTGHWWIATGNGFYGGLQFDLRTWRSVGGRGYPHWHSRLEQMYRAVLLIHRRGYAPWPICGSA